MWDVRIVELFTVAAWLAVCGGTVLAGVPANVVAIVEERCAGCHGGDKPESGVKLDGEWTAERLVSFDGNA